MHPVCTCYYSKGNCQVYVNYARLHYENVDDWLGPSHTTLLIRFCRLVCTGCMKLFAVKACSTFADDTVQAAYSFDDTTEYDLDYMSKMDFYETFFDPIKNLRPDYIRTWYNNTMSVPSEEEAKMFGHLSSKKFDDISFYNFFWYNGDISGINYDEPYVYYRRCLYDFEVEDEEYYYMRLNEFSYDYDASDFMQDYAYSEYDNDLPLV